MSMKNKGAGWEEIIQERKQAGHKKLEDPANPEWTVYVARSHVVDHETLLEARGQLKIGRGKYMNNIQRGRNQDGSDFRVYARVIVDSNESTHTLENYLKKVYANRKAVGPQTSQQELYDLKDSEIPDIMDTIVNFSKDYNIKIVDVKNYI